MSEINWAGNWRFSIAQALDRCSLHTKFNLIVFHVPCKGGDAYIEITDQSPSVRANEIVETLKRQSNGVSQLNAVGLGTLLKKYGYLYEVEVIGEYENIVHALISKSVTAENRKKIINPLNAKTHGDIELISEKINGADELFIENAFLRRRAVWAKRRASQWFLTELRERIDNCYANKIKKVDPSKEIFDFARSHLPIEFGLDGLKSDYEVGFNRDYLRWLLSHYKLLYQSILSLKQGSHRQQQDFIGFQKERDRRAKLIEEVEAEYSLSYVESVEESKKRGIFKGLRGSTFKAVGIPEGSRAFLRSSKEPFSSINEATSFIKKVVKDKRIDLKGDYYFRLPVYDGLFKKRLKFIGFSKELGVLKKIDIN